MVRSALITLARIMHEGSAATVDLAAISGGFSDCGPDVLREYRLRAKIPCKRQNWPRVSETHRDVSAHPQALGTAALDHRREHRHRLGDAATEVALREGLRGGPEDRDRLAAGLQRTVQTANVGYEDGPVAPHAVRTEQLGHPAASANWAPRPG